MEKPTEVRKSESDEHEDDQTDTELPKYMYLTDVVEGKEISRGSYGVVAKVFWHRIPCAAKTMHLSLDQREYVLKHFRREAQQWAVELRHPNIVQFLGLWEKDGVPAIVMELLYQDLSKFLEDHEMNKVVIPLGFTRSLAIDICRAFTYLESIGVIHRDLKGNNVLLTSHFVAKVSDFGAARLYDNVDRGKMTSDPGHKHYAAPEASGSDYGPEVDVFSYGCLLIEMLTYAFPMPKRSETLSEYEKREHLLDSLSPAVYEEFQPLIRRCLNNEPADRPKFAWLLDELSSEPFVTDDERYEIMNAELESLVEKKAASNVHDGGRSASNKKFPSAEEDGKSDEVKSTSISSSSTRPSEANSFTAREKFLIAIIVALFAIILYQHFTS